MLLAQEPAVSLKVSLELFHVGVFSRVDRVERVEVDEFNHEIHETHEMSGMRTDGSPKS